MLDECSKYRDAMGEVADNISLGTALETLWTTIEASGPAVPKKRGRKKKLVTDSAAAAANAAEASDAEPTAAELNAQSSELKIEEGTGLQGTDAALPVDSASGPLPNTQGDPGGIQGMPPAAKQLAPTGQELAQTDHSGHVANAEPMQTDATTKQPTASTAVGNGAQQVSPSAAAEAKVATSLQAPVQSKLISDVKQGQEPKVPAAVAGHQKQPLPQLDRQASLDSQQTNVAVSGAESSCTCSVSTGEPASENHTTAGCPVHNCGHSQLLSQHMPHATPKLEHVSALPNGTNDLSVGAVQGTIAEVLTSQAINPLQTSTATDSPQPHAPALLLNQSLSETSAAPQEAEVAMASAAVDAEPLEAAAEAGTSLVMQKLKRQLLDWHMANLEFANAAMLGTLSMRSWDQDDPFEIQGSHCFLPGVLTCYAIAAARNPFQCAATCINILSHALRKDILACLLAHGNMHIGCMGLHLSALCQAYVYICTLARLHNTSLHTCILASPHRTSAGASDTTPCIARLHHTWRA